MVQNTQQSNGAGAETKVRAREEKARDLLEDFQDSLTKTERAQIKFVRNTFDPGATSARIGSKPA